MFTVISIPSNQVLFLIYLLTWSYNVSCVAELFYYYFLMVTFVSLFMTMKRKLLDRDKSTHISTAGSRLGSAS